MSRRGTPIFGEKRPRIVWIFVDSRGRFPWDTRRALGTILGCSLFTMDDYFWFFWYLPLFIPDGQDTLPLSLVGSHNGFGGEWSGLFDSKSECLAFDSDFLRLRNEQVFTDSPER